MSRRGKSPPRSHFAAHHPFLQGVLVKKILINTLKISAAAVLAILVAMALKLDFAVSAGIVAILSVQPTKKETLRTALSRFLAFAVALAISSLLFNLLGFTLPVFTRYASFGRLQEEL